MTIKKIYYAFNTMLGCVGVFDDVPGTLKLGRYVKLGHSRSRAFVTDDEREFHSELRRNGFGATWTHRLRNAPRGWYDGVDETTGQLILREEAPA